MDKRKEFILKLIKDERRTAMRYYLNAVKEHHGTKAAERAWRADSYNQGVGPNIGCPNPGPKAELEDLTKARLDEVDAVYEYAVVTFIDGAENV